MVFFAYDIAGIGCLIGALIMFLAKAPTEEIVNVGIDKLIVGVNK